MDYLSLKALHIIFIVTWFAGMFYIVRLFIYSTEAHSHSEPERSILLRQYKIMSKRLWYGITIPSAILTLILGVSLLINREYLSDFKEHTWLHIKFAFLIGLYLYFFHLNTIFRKIQKDIFPYSSHFLRMWNELATLFLVAIIFLAVVKDGLNAMKSLLVFLLLTVILFISIKMYKRLRQNK